MKAIFFRAYSRTEDPALPVLARSDPFTDAALADAFERDRTICAPARNTLSYWVRDSALSAFSEAAPL